MSTARFLSLLPLAAAALAGCDPAASETPAEAATDPPGARWFVDMTAERGVDFSVDRAGADEYFMPDSMTPGCGLLDYDGDGDLDLYVVNGVRSTGGAASSPTGANRLYRQEADGRFTDVTADAGVGHAGYGMGVAAGDFDNDGYVDLFVTNFGPDVLYRNDGDGTFTDVTAAAGVGHAAWGASASFLDHDRDGDLDLFVVNYVDYDPRVQSRDAAGRLEYPAPQLFDGVPDLLYRNDGDGTFTDVSVASGVGGYAGRGLGVICADLSGDGLVDVYVANDGEANVAWINDGAGGFENRALVMGLAVSGAGEFEAGMGIAAGDCDADGDLDLLVTHLVQQTNTLYRQVAPGTFADATSVAGLGAPSIDETGFGAAFLDADLDGDLDLLVANGRVTRRVAHADADLGPHWTPYAEPNALYVNDGTGRFAPAGRDAGDLSAHVEVSRGLAVGDLDADGDLDVVVTNGNGTVRLYRNEMPRDGHWLIVRAIDAGRDALGAQVVVEAGDRRWRRDVRPAHSYLSSSDPRPHFGLGDASTVDRITVTWPDGTTEVFEGGAVDRIVEVRRGAGRADDA
jgi:hypothetical protein